MARKYITCPETGHLEEIEVQTDQDGIKIASCTRFSPACNVACEGECARRMERRNRTTRSDT